MKIALIGGTGFVGSAVLKELLDRGHEVVALARNTSKYTAQPRLKVVQADVLDAQQVTAAVSGAEAVVDAFNPGWSKPDIYNEFLAGTAAILSGIAAAGVRRVLVVGGAGSLYVAPGLQLIDTPEFPAEYKQGALAARKALKDLQEEQSLDWTFLSPPVFLAPGERTGNYRFGKDDVLMDGDKPAGISVEDLAVAIVDEIEEGRHIRQRFTVAN